LKYGDNEHHAAIVETTFDRAKVRGKALLFTTPLDDRRDQGDRPWNDYWQDWFGLPFANNALQYLAGSDADADLNFPVGRAVVVPFPAGVRAPAFTLTGPSVDVVVPRPEKALDFRLSQTATARSLYTDQFGPAHGRLRSA